MPGAGRILALLTVANVLNFYDRAIPAVVVEPVRRNLGKPAQDILNAVFKECETFGDARPFDDDATLVIVKHATPPV